MEKADPETAADLVRKLRGTVRVQGPGDTPAVIPDPLCQAAADQIEQLQAALANAEAEARRYATCQNTIRLLANHISDLAHG